jgi:hypothetical protein
MNSSRPSLSARTKDDGTVFASLDKQVALGRTAQELFGLGEVSDRRESNCCGLCDGSEEGPQFSRHSTRGDPR